MKEHLEAAAAEGTVSLFLHLAPIYKVGVLPPAMQTNAVMVLTSWYNLLIKIRFPAGK